MKKEIGKKDKGRDQEVRKIGGKNEETIINK
jgi:hypothetical protein